MWRTHWREGGRAGRVHEGITQSRWQVTVACRDKKWVDSRGKTEGESWKGAGNGWRAVKRRRLGRWWEPTKKSVVSSEGSWAGKEAGKVSMLGLEGWMFPSQLGWPRERGGGGSRRGIPRRGFNLIRLKAKEHYHSGQCIDSCRRTINAHWTFRWALDRESRYIVVTSMSCRTKTPQNLASPLTLPLCASVSSDVKWENSNNSNPVEKSWRTNVIYARRLAQCLPDRGKHTVSVTL